MANDDKKKTLRQRSRFAAMEGLRPHDGLPLAPRTAMSRARRASRKLPYPVPPYAGTFLPILLFDAYKEWDKLGRWKKVVAPAVVLVSLITWEQEQKKREAYEVVLERNAAKAAIAEVYGVHLQAPPRRKLFGVIPLPGKRK